MGSAATKERKKKEAARIVHLVKENKNTQDTIEDVKQKIEDAKKV